MYFNLFSFNKRMNFKTRTFLIIIFVQYHSQMNFHLGNNWINYWLCTVNHFHFDISRNSTQLQTAPGQPEDQTDGEQHCPHLSQTGRRRAREDLDLERRQLWVVDRCCPHFYLHSIFLWQVSRLHEDHQLWRTGRDLHGQDWHEDCLPSPLEWEKEGDRSQYKTSGHRALGCQCCWLQTSVVFMVSCGRNWKYKIPL